MGGYVVDMVILGAIGMIVVVSAGFMLLLSTDFAEQDPTDGDTYLFAVAVGLGAFLAWTLLNVLLLATRQQTGGQYVAGLRLARLDGAALTVRDVLVWWFCLNPLLFSWPMAAMVGFALLVIAALSAWQFMVFLALLIIALCVVAPLVALAAALFDAQHRGLHDRVVGTIVVPG